MQTNWNFFSPVGVHGIQRNVPINALLMHEKFQKPGVKIFFMTKFSCNEMSNYYSFR